MLYLIYNNTIAGTTDQTEGLPEGFIASEGPDAPLEALYWDGEQIRVIPPSPTPTAYWDSQTNSWKEL